MNIIDGLTFDDVLLVPKHSDILSRSEVNLSVNIKKNSNSFHFKHPIIPANMKSIMNLKMAEQITKIGGLGIMHRFCPIKEQYELLTLLNTHYNIVGVNNIGFSIGVKEEDKVIVSEFVNLGVKILCIDVAHGDSAACINMTEWISTNYPDILLIAGNVASADAAQRLWEAGADIVKVGVGPGCFAAGTRILMSNGFYKNIEEIKPGDFVINKDGNIVKVINAFSTGIRKISKLKNNIFYEDTYVTSDHKFWIGDLNSSSHNTLSSRGYSKLLDVKSKTVPKQSKYKWKQLSDLNQDVLLMPKKINFNLKENFKISLEKRNGGNYKTGAKYEVDYIISENYNSGYLFGTFLGDGNASCTEINGSHSGTVKWYFGLEETEIANKVINCIKTIFNKDAVINITDNIIKIIFYYKPLADYLNSWGKKENKKLPENLLVSSKEYLVGLYDGLLDSDGHYNKDGRKTLGNTSIYIIELFNIISYLLFGVFPNNSKEKITSGGLKNCNVNNCKQPYKSQILKNGKVRLTNDYQIVKILGFQELDIEVPVYDITVDCDTHSFIANNMIVHNSLCTTRIETGNGVPQLTALMDIYDRKEQLLDDHFKEIYIIADGGLKNSGDVVKALCFSDMVMAGNLFAGCTESPGSMLNVDGKMYKEYAGSSTHKTNHIEGVVAMVHPKGKYKEIISKLLEGLRSGCSYQGAHDLTELKRNPQFVRITTAGLRESHPHDVQMF